jgi:hypothetical protein
MVNFFALLRSSVLGAAFTESLWSLGMWRQAPWSSKCELMRPFASFWQVLAMAILSQLQSSHEFRPKDLTDVSGFRFQRMLQEIRSLYMPGVGALAPFGTCPPKYFA